MGNKLTNQPCIKQSKTIYSSASRHCQHIHENLQHDHSRATEKKLTQFIEPSSISQTIADFLTDRWQNMRFGKTGLSGPYTLSILLLPIHQWFHCPPVAPLLGFISNNDQSVNRLEVEQLWVWCWSQSPSCSSILRKQEPHNPQSAHIKKVEPFKYLGPIMPYNFKRDIKTNFITENSSANAVLPTAAKKN